MSSKPWRGVLTATALPFTSDLAVDYDAFAEHVAWQAAQGCDGVVPNGSLGEYQTLTPEERAKVVEVAVQASPKDFVVMPGVAAYGTAESVRWAEQAAKAGAQCVMLLPPNAYRGDERAVLQHYKEVAAVGLPVIAYNNPIDTKIDLVPGLLAKLHEIGYIVAVKEFTGDVVPTTACSNSASPARVAGWPETRMRCRSPRSSCTGCHSRGMSRRRCRCIALCIRCCAGTRRPNSSSRSNSRWTWSAATVESAAHRANH